MIFRYIRLYSASLILLISAMASAQTFTLSLLETIPLSDTLSETSGLACYKESIYTLNDSGNPPYLFALTASGSIAQAIKLTVVNIDWEAIDMDDHFIYVADTGNNHGNRQQVVIHKVPRKGGGSVASLSIEYTGNRFDHNIPYQHDYDVEALVVQNHTLLLFTKSWQSGIAHVYQISLNLSKQKVSPVAHIENLPGMVTGAAWDSKNQQFVLVGYSGNAVWGYKPFLAVVDKQYKLVGTHALSGRAQVEAVCIRPDGEVWLTQEASSGSPAMLIKLSAH